ncbi:Saccharopine dehydrogenase [Aspergillus nanangensis]|uniref:Saccharopine dehydrogenase n=1 Tax=Aspergillus nanangensis TaxID=2582783 RepID=A0AAD4CMM0_ASPNN|nr:Saccharopine dehydrogenase [Aspergillus nanangensis]
MKGTSVFNFRPWSKIHPPLPRTPRESQQLLNALTSSFRRQLDCEFPPTSSSTSREKSGSTDRSRRNPDSSVQATDRHLRAILDNPLFRVVPSKPSKPTANRDPSGMGSIEQQRLAKEPMAVFDELVASGSVTVSGLRNCLKSQLLLASPHTGSGFVKAMRDSKAGSKVVTWWFASDSETRKILFKSRASTASLLKFLVAEGLQETVMMWLRMLAKHDIGGRRGRLPETIAQQVFSNLLVDLLSAETQYGRGLSMALRYYLQACRSHLPVADEVASQLRAPMLLPAATHFCQSLMRSAQTETRQIPVSIYNDFITSISLLSPKSLLLATAPIYHPTKPDTKPFLEHLDGLTLDNLETWAETKRENLLRAAFDALRLSIDQERLRDASYIARFIQQQLPDKPDTGTASENGHLTSAEEEDLLARLDLALT